MAARKDWNARIAPLGAAPFLRAGQEQKEWMPVRPHEITDPMERISHEVEVVLNPVQLEKGTDNKQSSEKPSEENCNDLGQDGLRPSVEGPRPDHDRNVQEPMLVLLVQRDSEEIGEEEGED